MTIIGSPLHCLMGENLKHDQKRNNGGAFRKNKHKDNSHVNFGRRRRVAAQSLDGRESYHRDDNRRPQNGDEHN